MNIIGHLSIGAIGYSITKDPLWFIGSVIPDIALIPNEIKFKKFDKWNVRGKFLYDITHSLYTPFLLWFLSPVLSLAVLLHILVDIPFHSSTFRWKPFLFNRYKSKKKALLLSGGMDSVACGFIEEGWEPVYFDYGQEYHELEYPKAKQTAKLFGKKLRKIKRSWGHDAPNRNFLMILELKKQGYDEVIIGSRNILPFTDKYGDSNWLSLKLLQFLFGIYINMPITGLFKFQVKQKLNGWDGYWSSEGYEKH